MRSDPAVRFRSKVEQAGPDDCWPWTGRVHVTRGGYGAFDDEERRTYGVSRHAIELIRARRNWKHVR